MNDQDLAKFRRLFRNATGIMTDQGRPEFWKALEAAGYVKSVPYPGYRFSYDLTPAGIAALTEKE